MEQDPSLVAPSKSPLHLLLEEPPFPKRELLRPKDIRDSNQIPFFGFQQYSMNKVIWFLVAHWFFALNFNTVETVKELAQKHRCWEFSVSQLKQSPSKYSVAGGRGYTENSVLEFLCLIVKEIFIQINAIPGYILQVKYL